MIMTHLQLTALIFGIPLFFAAFFGLLAATGFGDAEER
jgi:hypothetical protein